MSAGLARSRDKGEARGHQQISSSLLGLKKYNSPSNEENSNTKRA